MGIKRKGKKEGDFPPPPPLFAHLFHYHPQNLDEGLESLFYQTLPYQKLPYVPPPPKGRFPGCFTWAILGELPREALIPLLVLIVIGSN